MKYGEVSLLKSLLLGLCGFLPIFLLATLVESDFHVPDLDAKDLDGHTSFEYIFESAQREIEPQRRIDSFNYEKTLLAKVTAYTPGEESCGIYSDGFTSTGQNAWQLKGVAADPKVLPYGTWLYIPGMGYRVVDDTGAAMRRAWSQKGEVHIDLRFGNVKNARRWGVRHLQVHVYFPKESI